MATEHGREQEDDMTVDMVDRHLPGIVIEDLAAAQRRTIDTATRWPPGLLPRRFSPVRWDEGFYRVGGHRCAIETGESGRAPRGFVAKAWITEDLLHRCSDVDHFRVHR